MSHTEAVTVGRSVHCLAVLRKQVFHRAAIVTVVHADGTVDLTVFGSNGSYLVWGAHYADPTAVVSKKLDKTWHWPERVAQAGW